MEDFKQLLEEINTLRKNQKYATTFMYCLNHRVHYLEEEDNLNNEFKFRYDLHENCKVLESDGCEYSDFNGIKKVFEYLMEVKK